MVQRLVAAGARRVDGGGNLVQAIDRRQYAQVAHLVDHAPQLKLAEQVDVGVKPVLLQRQVDRVLQFLAQNNQRGHGGLDVALVGVPAEHLHHDVGELERRIRRHFDRQQFLNVVVFEEFARIAFVRRAAGQIVFERLDLVGQIHRIQVVVDQIEVGRHREILNLVF